MCIRDRLTPAGIFVIYNCGTGLMKWRYKSELRMKTLMWTVLCQQRLASQFRPEDVDVYKRQLILRFMRQTAPPGISSMQLIRWTNLLILLRMVRLHITSLS